LHAINVLSEKKNALIGRTAQKYNYKLFIPLFWLFFDGFFPLYRKKILEKTAKKMKEIVS